jgi:hypothetical protein
MSDGEQRAAFEKWWPDANVPQHMRKCYTASDVEHAEKEAAYEGWLAAQAQRAPEWQPIETAPQDGFLLVHEDTAIRTLLRIKGVWHKTCYPAIMSPPPWEDAIVGADAKRMLPAGYRLEARDGCCENPTHWMPLPAPPLAATSPQSETPK